MRTRYIKARSRIEVEGFSGTLGQRARATASVTWDRDLCDVEDLAVTTEDGATITELPTHERWEWESRLADAASADLQAAAIDDAMDRRAA